MSTKKSLSSQTENKTVTTSGLVHFRTPKNRKRIPKYVMTLAWKRRNDGTFEVGGTVFQNDFNKTSSDSNSSSKHKYYNYSRKAHNKTAKGRLEKRPLVINNEILLEGRPVVEEFNELLNARKFRDFQRRLRQTVQKYGCVGENRRKIN